MNFTESSFFWQFSFGCKKTLMMTMMMMIITFRILKYSFSPFIECSKDEKKKKQCFNWNNKKHYILMMVVCLKLSNNWLTCFDSIQSLKYCRLVRRFLTLMNLFFSFFTWNDKKIFPFLSYSFVLFVCRRPQWPY